MKKVVRKRKGRGRGGKGRGEVKRERERERGRGGRGGIEGEEHTARKFADCCMLNKLIVGMDAILKERGEEGRTYITWILDEDTCRREGKGGG